MDKGGFAGAFRSVDGSDGTWNGSGLTRESHPPRTGPLPADGRQVGRVRDRG